MNHMLGFDYRVLQNNLVRVNIYRNSLQRIALYNLTEISVHSLKIKTIFNFLL